MSENFDWEKYLNMYEDLQRAGYKTKEKALNHWNRYGKFESRNYTTYDLNVLHILHNYGGGTETYVDNLINIFSRHKHFKIKLTENHNINLNKFIENNNINLIFAHHFLYNKKEGGHSIDKNFIEDTISVSGNIKKLFIIHDYFLLYPDTPNPILSDVKEPLIRNINYANYVLNSFDKVIFNSQNTYDFYHKFLKLDNKLLLNIVPDIDILNNRIYPSKKNNYNIGIIGSIHAEHKGNSVAKKIFNLCKDLPYTFKVFGDFNEKFDNVVNVGKYVNENIFNLIQEQEIDMFIFVSRFPETYSYCLSIALKTGLPIIYNNVGAYIERTINYNNCYKFDERKLDELPGIITSITSITSNTSNTSNDNTNYILYKNVPELSEYILVNDIFNWDFSNINIKLGSVCFIHACNINSGMEILTEQINYIKTSGLYDKLDYIFVTLLGPNTLIYNDSKIKLIYYSAKGDEWEFPTIKRIKHFSNNFPDCNVLYIHTKGVLNKNNAYKWRKYLEYFLIGCHDICIKALKNYYCVGVNKQIFPYTKWSGENKDHFSGNFWWAQTNYIKKLDMINHRINDRYVAEHYLIGKNKDYRYFLSLHNTTCDFYQTYVPEEQYLIPTYNNINKLDTGIIVPIYGVYFICCIGNYLDIVKEQITKLISSELYENTEKIFCFICLVTDDIINLLNKYNKIVIISTSENLYEKYAINNMMSYLNNSNEKDYYVYYIHTKSVTRTEKCYTDWRLLCEHFTITKWYLNVKLLDRFDCVGTNLKNFPSIHFSGNFWWSKSDHLKRLKDIDDRYLSPEMFICSLLETNYVSLFQSYITHGNKEFNEDNYITLSNKEILKNILIVPDFNIGDKDL